MDRHLRGRLDSEAHFVASNFHDGDDDLIVDHNALILLAAQDEHTGDPFRWEGGGVEASDVPPQTRN